MITNIKLISTALFLIFLFTLLITSCDQESKGFALPPGDKARGIATFNKLYCNECHSVGNIEWAGNPDELHFELGGGVPFKKTYGELVTAIINPSHKVAKQYYGHDTEHPEGSSKMAYYNELMTVQELVDIVSFLEGEYQIERPVTYYPIFH